MKLGRMFAAAALAPIALAASAAVAAPRQANWNLMVAQTPQGGHLVGNPAAPVKLIEYVSYTCSHCATFEMEADAPLRLTFIAGGKGSVEYRPLIRSKIDVAAALLARCGPIAKFRGNHTAILRAQDKWNHAPSPAELQRWSSADFTTSMRAIARDLKLYDLMQARGYARPELDRCLADRASADKMAAQTRYALEELRVRGTPSFLVNGELLDSHSWEGLRPRLMELTR